MFSSLKIRNFRLYWIGMFVSLIGTWIQSMAMSWLVFQLTNSAFMLGMVSFLSSIPIFSLSFFGGVIADRVNKKSILLFTQIIFMISAFVFAALIQFKLITPWLIMAAALGSGIVMAFDAPARQAMIVELVGKKHLLNAIALNSVSFNSSRMIGPALAGVLISIIGMSGCFYINGISFLAVIIALLFINVKSSPNKNRNNHILKDLQEGLVFVKSSPLIIVLVSIVGVMSLFGTSYVILMPIFANDILKVGVKGLAVLTSSVGIGALISALILAALGDFKFKGKMVMLSSLGFAASLILFSFSGSYLFSILSLALSGLTSIMTFALVNTMLQTMVVDEFRGRVMSVFMFTFAGIMPFGNLIAGSLASTIGALLTVRLSGFICLLLFLVINIRFPQIRKI